MIRTLAITFLLLLYYAGQCQLQINEACSKNTSLVTGFLGSTPDFIELLNAGDDEIQLSDYYLSDDTDELDAWRLPNRLLAPAEIIVIWCDNDTDSPIQEVGATEFFHLSKPRRNQPGSGHQHR